MTLLEFLRQWQPSRLTAAGIASVVLHVLLVFGILWTKPADPKSHQKKGDALFVELPKENESPPPGSPGPPPTPPPAPRPAPPVAARPEPPRPVAKPVPPAPPAPRPAPERRVAAAPPPSPQGSEPAPAPAPRAAETPPAPREPEPSPPATQGGPQVAAIPPGPSGGLPGPDIRSLGRGGAGGRGFDRGGIEGEPIPINSPDPKFREYLKQLQQMIQGKMTWPCKGPGARGCENGDAVVLIEFGILKNGQLQFVDLRRSNGAPAFEDNSANAIKLASPFPPPPAAMLAAMKEGSTGIAILGHFTYSHTISLRGMLH